MKFDDWSEFHQHTKEREEQEYQRFNDERRYYQEWTRQAERLLKNGFPDYSCYATLGISSTATNEQITQAFRNKVKEAADGQGGYTIDMDKLVQAKEQALARCK